MTTYAETGKIVDAFTRTAQRLTTGSISRKMALAIIQNGGEGFAVEFDNKVEGHKSAPIEKGSTAEDRAQFSIGEEVKCTVSVNRRRSGAAIVTGWTPT